MVWVKKISNNMKNTGKFTFKIVGIENNIACLRAKNTGCLAMAENANHIGKVDDVVELSEKHCVFEGQLAEYQMMWDKYNE
jgi:hypothetical protein